MTNPEVIFEEMQGQGGDLGIITLNRPEVLNSLNHTMIHAMHQQLKAWDQKQSIKAVVIKASPGRAFCAGGDLRFTYEKMKVQDVASAQFFHDEYQLNRYIFHYPKPYIALLDGITMGGGVGISIHGSHRIATDRLIFAMPETGIGFFPDVGGTYFLPRLPGCFGLYLGLTGARLTSDDCMALGLVQAKVSHDLLPQLVEALAQHPFNHDARASVTNVISQFKSVINPSSVLEQENEINKCFSMHSIEMILDALSLSTSALCQDAAIALAKKSPTSLKVTLAAIGNGLHLDFDGCMQQEYRLACRFTMGHDFPEGIRALIVDKDQKPQWSPDTLARVTSQMIKHYFSPITIELFQ